ncbi:GntR family transcriptional regulator [Blastococcus xanthinilyticus]|uniref:GntR family transcriptional regulator n=1 Tax=Blastococcus xanthinilyticus TaxID=1564164 RepID=A0A5S5CQN3_9ACTN|nr:GntR family transcriptional regulator [Blastococcus xanthinilyticus]TYP82927.1 GntR family transcriptional regulator [Blastococcus xanthinilyticus]
MLEGRPIATLPLREHVYERLQELLISRTLAPGDHLVEERLAAQLGVSRGPVREALQRLHRDGWITIRPRYGAFVKQPTAREVHEFFEARELVEREATRLAAERCTPEDAARLLEICDQADADRARGVPTQEMAAHTARFHLAVLESARNHILLAFGEQLSQRSRWFFAPLVSSIAPRAWAEHRLVAELIGAGEAGAAAEAMHSHVALSRDSYLDIHPDGVTFDRADAAVPPSPRALGSRR